ncbi:MAG: histidine--tRNA ligase, partial [Methanomassiliicoccus sp.]
DLMRRSMSKNLKYASAIGARYAIIVGSKEMAEQSVTLRDMLSGDQRIIAIEQISEEITKLL